MNQLRAQSGEALSINFMMRTQFMVRKASKANSIKVLEKLPGACIKVSTINLEEPMENRSRFSFTGTGGALLLIYLKNIILSIITLGIYSFWARVNITRYMYQNTVFMDSNFEYHATGKEKFIGFLKALGIFAVYVAFLAGLEYVLGMFLDPAVTPLIEMAVIYLTILAAVPFIMVGSDRYRLQQVVLARDQVQVQRNNRAVRENILPWHSFAYHHPWLLRALVLCFGQVVFRKQLPLRLRAIQVQRVREGPDKDLLPWHVSYCHHVRHLFILAFGCH